MRGLPRRIMIRLAEAIMIASDAALARHFVPKEGSAPFYSPALRAAHAPEERRSTYAGGRRGKERLRSKQRLAAGVRSTPPIRIVWVPADHDRLGTAAHEPPWQPEHARAASN